jgi:alginate O-acetyltransferase complex protein AlgJ
LLIAWLLASGAASPNEANQTQVFLAACQSLLDQAPEKGRHTAALLGHENWVILVDELRYATSGQFWGDAALTTNPRVRPALVDPLPAIVGYQQLLAELGVELIVAPVPIRPAVYPESVVSGTAIAQNALPGIHRPQQEFFELLRASGIQVVDFTPLFVDNRFGPTGPVFCPTESHWTGSGIVLAAHKLAGEITSKSWYTKVAKVEFSTEWKTKPHIGNLYRVNKDQLPKHVREPDQMAFRVVREVARPDSSIELRNPDSPVILLGDSNTLFLSEDEASLAHQLAFELGFPVDLVAVKGGGATAARINLLRTLQGSPGYLDNKKTVIWVFAARSFTGRDGWFQIPMGR